MAQRWLIVQSEAALERAEATITQARPREEAAITRPRFHRQATRFQTPEVAQDAGGIGHALDVPPSRLLHLIAHTRCQQRPSHTAHPLKALAGQIQARVRPDQEVLRPHQHVKAGVGLGTHRGASELSDAAVMAAYKGQSCVEGGRWLKDPLLFVSSWLVKKPSRIEGLWMVMPLALLVYSVAQRRMRRHLTRHHETVPNHITHPHVTDLTVGVPTLGRHSRRSGDGAGSGA